MADIEEISCNCACAIDKAIMKDPRLSVIMPVYNAEEYVAEAVKSVLAQSYRDLELIVVDDFSTDSSRAIVEEFKQVDSRVIISNNSFKKGIVGALNTGLEKARGELIARADSDDINRDKRFEIQIQFLDCHRNISVVGAGYSPFGENGRKRDILHPLSSVEIAWGYIHDSFFCHPTVMFRSEVYRRIGGYPEVPAEDFGLFSEVVKRYQCANIGMVLLDYREHSTNLSYLRGESISSYVRNKYYENYKYYVGHRRNADAFYKYITSDKIALGKLIPTVWASLKILNKIRRAYGLRWIDLMLLERLGKVLKASVSAFVRFWI